MTKVLNLDDVKGPDKTISLGGKTYQILPLSVSGYVEITKITQNLQNEDMGESDQLTLMTRIIGLAIPKMAPGVINTMTIPQLMALTDFIREQEEEDMPEAEDTEEGK